MAQNQDSGPKRIKELRFSVCSPQDLIKQSVVEVTDRHIYNLHGGDGNERPVTPYGPLDRRLGTSSGPGICETCHKPLKGCNGHFGHVRLALPAFHVGYLKKIIEILHCICKTCSRILLDEQSQRTFLKVLRRQNLDILDRKAAVRRVLLQCKKVKECPHCKAVNGVVRKVAGHALKIVHDRFSGYNLSQSKSKEPPPSKMRFERSFREAMKTNVEVDKHLKKAMDDLHPLRVLNLFTRITSSDCEILGMNPEVVRPEMLIWTHVPAPPVAIRPSVQQDNASTEDDITNKLGDIIHISSIIRGGIQKGQPVQTIMEQWDYLQIQVAMYINSEVPNLQPSGFGKPIRGFVQRLKGKQGRFRGNLSGKRVDFSARTVISPDPNLGIDEVAIPDRVAMTLTYPETVTSSSIEKLRARIRNGARKHPGANFIVKNATGFKVILNVLSGSPQKLDAAAKNLVIGDIVHRHLIDGDIVLFNRQPSLHKLSIMCHKVKVRNFRTFRLNECVCTPYNADFDGDEMNLHVPQTEEARAEALELMGVKHNLATPKDGTPIIAATQDFVTASYLLSNKDRFFDRKTFSQICCYMFDGKGIEASMSSRSGTKGDNRIAFDNIEIPEPTICKPESLWTGKQIFNVLMRPNRQSKILVNFDAAGRYFSPTKGQSPDLNDEDCWLSIRNSEVMCGAMDKDSLGAGKKDSLFYVIMRDFGPDAAVQTMNRLAKLSARWLSDQGFSIGIDDVYPGPDLVQKKQELIDSAYERCDEIIETFKERKLERDPGCNQEETMENRISGILSEVRQKAGALCFENLTKWNSPIIMAKSGAKGSSINVSQMVATVGQQIINSARVADGFQDRTLPHFPKGTKQPPSKGFVQNSFFTGLTPTEFIFHAMSGREGLVDTAVKTAETGYMSRRLMKSLEDLSVQYDDTVRNCSSAIVQFMFGEDGLDPVDMEGKAKPVNFERSFLHAQTSKYNTEDKAMTPEEVKNHVHVKLQKEKNQYLRTSLTGRAMDYASNENEGIDQFESRRSFLDSLEYFIGQRAHEVENARKIECVIQIPVERAVPEKPKRGRPSTKITATRSVTVNAGDFVAKISQSALDNFIELCLTKYQKSRVSPGHAVGAVAAQSIGEPGTQMTLKTFHFAGVAGMSITQGVPRIKEIINGSKVISTPVITCPLVSEDNDVEARLVRSRIEKTHLRDIISYMQEVWTPDKAKLQFKIDVSLIERLQLDISLQEIRKAIINARGFKQKYPHQVKLLKDDVISITLANDTLAPARFKRRSPRAKGRTTFASGDPLPQDTPDPFATLQHLKRALPSLAIKGLPDVSRAVISKIRKTTSIPSAAATTLDNTNKSTERNVLLVEGYGLLGCMTTPGIIGTATRTNNIAETHAILGIEAARASIIAELTLVMGEQMDIDPRHMQLLADVMTAKGDVLGITRFGLAKMRESVLQLASFEKTSDHLFEAAVEGRSDPIEGVSECVILGKPIRLGTGCMQIMRDLGISKEEMKGTPTMFEDACRA